MEFQSEKRIVLAHHAALDGADPMRIGAVLEAGMTSDVLWRGFHPFHELVGPDAIATRFWQPFRRAFTRMQRRPDIFMAGRNEIDGFQSVWVVSMGHLMGLFDNPWLGIAPTGKMAFLRYCEFSRIEDGRIAEVAMYFDIPHLMIQAGYAPFAHQSAAHLVQPGPIGHDGLLFDAQDTAEGAATLATINAMISDLGTWKLGLPLEQELARTWQDDMIWWGPSGIGATYTIERYAKQHAAPFRASFSDRSRTSHICRLAEGAFGGFFGWPNFSARHTGNLMGMPPSDTPAEFRVIDIYRRSGEKLAENWIFVDLLHYWNMLGVDVLGRALSKPPRRPG